MNFLHKWYVLFWVGIPGSFWGNIFKLGLPGAQQNTNLQLLKIVERLRLGTVRIKWVEKHRKLPILNRLTDHHSF